MLKVPVHVEVEVKPECKISRADIVQKITNYLRESCPIFQNGEISCPVGLATSVRVCDLYQGQSVSFWQAELCIHAHRLSEQGNESDFIEGEEALPACEQWELPNIFLRGLWESIIVDDVIKNRLISYCSSSIQFSEALIDPNIISWNRMVLIHGPPGTGKTTLCKALAQKMFIRNSQRYNSGMLLEVNSHSLFSKWFSESGKLVMKMFAHIAELAEDTDCLVVVLIDEVESITSARDRSASSSSSEPGDAVRVVNAVLTSLDSLKRLQNVLLLCTSNLIDSVDAAFMDRVDMKVFLGNPNHRARFSILQSCLMELMHKQLIAPAMSFDMVFDELVRKFQMAAQVDHGGDIASYCRSFALPMFAVGYEASRSTGAKEPPESPQLSSLSLSSRPSPSQLSFEEYLFLVAALCHGSSGRALRKLPIRAHAFYLQRPVVKVEEFIAAMHAVVGGNYSNDG